MSITRFTSYILLVASVLASGCSCSAPKPTPDPLAGYHFSSLVNLQTNKAITDDYQDYIQKLPPRDRHFVGPVFYFEDGSGQHAVSLEIFVESENAAWRYALIYDKDNKRVKAVRYDYHRYQS